MYMPCLGWLAHLVKVREVVVGAHDADVVHQGHKILSFGK